MHVGNHSSQGITDEAPGLVISRSSESSFLIECVHYGAIRVVRIRVVLGEFIELSIGGHVTVVISSHILQRSVRVGALLHTVLATSIDRLGLLSCAHSHQDIDLKNVTIDRSDTRNVGSWIVSCQRCHSFRSTATELFLSNGILKNANVGTSNPKAAKVLPHFCQDILHIIIIPVIVNQLISEVSECTWVTRSNLRHCSQGVQFNKIRNRGGIIINGRIHVIYKIANKWHIHLGYNLVDCTTKLHVSRGACFHKLLYVVE
mmetsp:Transcript_16933/g.36840  ORF Transcript_16933/g.36840 Transcript_16933/m.36840 type:complete len:260 (+) Transcript_16933:4682-5461(+)